MLSDNLRWLFVSICHLIKLYMLTQWLFIHNIEYLLIETEEL